MQNVFMYSPFCAVLVFKIEFSNFKNKIII